MTNLIHPDPSEVLHLAKLGASVRTIAAQTGISKSTVSRILRGERVVDRVPHDGMMETAGE